MLAAAAWLLLILPAPAARAVPDEARRLNDDGVAAYEEGNFPHARTCFEAALALDDDYAEPHANLGLLAFAEEDHVGAARRLATALARDASLAVARDGLFELIETLGGAETPPARAVEPLALVAELVERSGQAPPARAARAALVAQLARLDRAEPADYPRILDRAFAGRNASPEERAALDASRRALDPGRRAAFDAALARAGLADVRDDAPPEGALEADRFAGGGAPESDSDAAEAVEPFEEVAEMIRRGETAKAHARIRAMRKADGASATAVFLEATRLLKAGAKRAAREEARAFDPVAAGSARLLLAGGALLSRLDLREQARACFEEGAARFPGEPEFRFHLALAALQEGRADEARDRLLALLAERPDQPRTLYFLVDACERLGRTDEAAAARDRVFALAPAGRYASWLRRRLGATPAERLVREASGEAAFLSDESLERSGDTTPVELLERLALTRPDLRAPLRLLAVRRAASGDDLGALACLLALRERGALLRVEPSAVADAWLAAGFPGRAAKELSAAERDYPGDPYLLLKRGIARFAEGATAEATSLWNSVARGPDLAAAALARDLVSGDALPDVPRPEDPGAALDRLARMLLQYAAPETAHELLEARAAEGSKESLLLLAELLAAARKYDRALAALDRFAKAHGPDRELLVASADLCRRAGAAARGVALLEEAERLGPLSSHEQALLGDLLVRAGRHEEALVRYHRALKAGLTGLRRGEILKRAAVARDALRKEKRRGH